MAIPKSGVFQERLPPLIANAPKRVFHATRTPKQIFDQYAGDDGYGFDKTRLAFSMALKQETLVSRSEARRIAAQFVDFKEIILDFSGVEMMTQAFADELFRVFWRQHPQIHLIPIHANTSVSQMITGAILHDQPKNPLA